MRGVTVTGDRFGRAAKKRAAERALTRAVQLEQACALVARQTGDVVAGVDPEGFQRIYLDELGRRQVPNRAMRRAARKRLPARPGRAIP